MAEPSTPGEARRQGLRKTRWIAAGASVGAAVLLTGTIAVVNAAPSNATGSSVTSPSGQARQSDDGARSYDDDSYGSARPYTPTQQVPTQQVPTFTPRPQTRTRGS